MGYDCSVRNPRISAPEVDWTDAESRQAYWDWQKDAHTYFRRNIFGAGPLADALIQMGMGFDAHQFGVDHPAFPDPDDFGVTFDDEGQTVGARAAEYKAALDAVLDWHGPEIPGIPIHKVCTSNDGWHVTKAECDAALHMYEFGMREGLAHPDAFHDDFIPFLRVAADGDGFEVW